MHPAKPLPDFLVRQHREWRSGMAPETFARLERLATDGQAPPAMMIACCDSRVMDSGVFKSEPGEIFVHRNIANLVPACTLDNTHHGTSATIEFAVTALKVRHLIVMGHYACGGVEACLTRFLSGVTAPDDSFITRWLDILAPRVPDIAARYPDREDALRALEREAVLLSLENLMSFPFVEKAVSDGRLELHGIWNHIRGGVLEYLDPESGRFLPV